MRALEKHVRSPRTSHVYRPYHCCIAECTCTYLYTYRSCYMHGCYRRAWLVIPEWYGISRIVWKFQSCWGISKIVWNFQDCLEFPEWYWNSRIASYRLLRNFIFPCSCGAPDQVMIDGILTTPKMCVYIFERHNIRATVDTQNMLHVLAFAIEVIFYLKASENKNFKQSCLYLYKSEPASQISNLCFPMIDGCNNYMPAQLDYGIFQQKFSLSHLCHWNSSNIDSIAMEDDEVLPNNKHLKHNIVNFTLCLIQAQWVQGISIACCMEKSIKV